MHRIDSARLYIRVGLITVLSIVHLAGFDRCISAEGQYSILDNRPSKVPRYYFVLSIRQHYSVGLTEFPSRDRLPVREFVTGAMHILLQLGSCLPCVLRHATRTTYYLDCMVPGQGLMTEFCHKSPAVLFLAGPLKELMVRERRMQWNSNS